MAEMHVELHSPERKVWSGTASMVIARTAEGEIGVLPGHAPVLSVLANGPLEIRPADGGQPVRAAVYGGFLSIVRDQVSILAEAAEFADEISVADAEAQLREAQEADDEAAIKVAQARVAVAARSGH